jgi:hypothetical protein
MPVSSEERPNRLAYRSLCAALQILEPTASEKIAQRHLKTSAKRLARRLEDFRQSEFGELAKNEILAASLGVCAAMDGLIITNSTVIDKTYDAAMVYAILLPPATFEWRAAFITQAGEEYGKKFLREVSKFIVTTLQELPDLESSRALNPRRTWPTSTMSPRGARPSVQRARPRGSRRPHDWGP